MRWARVFPRLGWPKFYQPQLARNAIYIGEIFKTLQSDTLIHTYIHTYIYMYIYTQIYIYMRYVFVDMSYPEWIPSFRDVQFHVPIAAWESPSRTRRNHYSSQAVGGWRMVMVHHSSDDSFGDFFLPKIPSAGKHTENYGKSQFSMGKSTISLAIFNSKLWMFTRGYWGL